MSAPATIKFTQGASTPPAGQALDAVAGTAVTGANGNDSGIASWAWSLVDAPPGSALSPGSLGVSAAMTPFTPDVAGTYLVKLVTTDTSGLVTQDYRAAMVKVDSTYSRHHPGSFAGSLGLNETSHNYAPGNVGTPNARGFAPLIESYLGVIDRLGDVGGAAPTSGQVPAWNAANHRYEPATPGGGFNTVINPANNYVALANDAVVVTVAGNVTKLPAAPSADEEVMVMNMSGGAATVDPNGGTIYGVVGTESLPDDSSRTYRYVAGAVAKWMRI